MIKRFFNRLSQATLPWFTVPLLLLGVGVLCYGILIPWLGYYWDDWAFIWIAKSAGPAGLTRYFATNRPFWGEIIKLSTSLLGTSPWVWQLFGLFWRVASSISLWWLACLLWPGQHRAAAWIGLAFLVFPGFFMQFVAVNMGHFFIVFTSLLLSMCFTLLALRGRKNDWLFHLPALLLSAVNLLAMEYFFLLELLRPFVIWLAFSDKKVKVSKRLIKTAIHWAVYLALFVGVTVWRFFIFPYQERYPLSLLSELRVHPLQAIGQFLVTVGKSFFAVLVAGWGEAFRIPNITILGKYSFLALALMVIISLGLLWLFFRKLKSPPIEQERHPRWPLQALLLGGIALLLGGFPFWLTDLPIQLAFPTNRFIVPSILAASLILVGLIGLLTWLPRPWRWISTTFLVLIISLSIGRQFVYANAFRRDWDLQQRFFWQLSWRVPSLRSGTLLLSNELPSTNVSDNSVVAPVNWIYAPDYHSGSLPFMFFYPSVRLGTSLPALSAGVDVEKDYLVAKFQGSTSHALSIFFDPPGCLQVLDPALDAVNLTIPELMRSASTISNLDQIVSSGQITLPDSVFKQEPEQEWCYFFEKAELAAQTGQWQQVVKLGELAFALGETPADASERFPFIEGYAHTGDWVRAIELTSQSAAVTPLIQPALCQLWQRINIQVSEGPAKSDAIKQANSMLACTLP